MLEYFLEYTELSYPHKPTAKLTSVAEGVNAEKRTVSVLINRSEARLLCSDTTPARIFFADAENMDVCQHEDSMTIITRNCALCIKEPVRTCHHGKNFFFNQQLADTLLPYEEIVILGSEDSAVAFHDFLKSKDYFASKNISLKAIKGIL